jgi:polyphosphate:AMP phosphotransferase
MFESAEIGHQMDKQAYREAEKELRQALLQAQFALLASRHHAVVVLVNGVDGAGKGETVNLFNEWMDPRHIRTEAFAELTPAQREVLAGRSDMWRFWQVLPPKGHIGILFGNWYTDPIVQRAQGRDSKSRFESRLEGIRAFERMLVAEGVLLVKLWFHMTRAGVEKRFKALAKDPRTAWRVTAADKARLAHYDELVSTAATALRKTSTAEAPWLVVDGSDPRYRAITAGRYLLTHLQRAAQPPSPTPTTHAAPLPPPPLDGRSLLDSFDYRRTLARPVYEEQLDLLQGRLNTLLRAPRLQQRSLVLVFEGMDAAGKGSTIRRITQAMDARHYRVVPIAAPNEAERAQPYLWRFWRYLPQWRHTVIFDRSWYGRVLVERVEGFCSEADWTRAYDEINAFEEQMTEAGSIVVKFWLAITADEQLRRFEARQNTPYKQHKITPEDWRNRDKWPLYARAVDDMIDRTSTELAPWHVVASDDKLWSRIEVLKILSQRLEEASQHHKKRRPKTP